jgi:heat shock protein HtpX
MKNTMKTFLLLAALTALLMLVGGALGGRGGMMIALLMAVFLNFGMYWFSDSIVLRMTGARPLAPGKAPQLEAMVARLAQRAGIPVPRLFLVENPTPNAFATGRSPERGVIAVHSGLLQILDRAEVEGVLAHEMGHILNRDTLISAIAATFAGAIGTIANMAMWGAMLGGRSDEREGDGFGGLLMILLAPLMATLIQLAVSRSREYQADATAARLTGRPLDLADALAKLEQGSHQMLRRGFAGADPSVAHLMIVNPLSGGSVASLFSTHPPIAERIGRLRQMAGR